MSMVTFLPWMKVQSSISVGEFTLIPYKRNHSPVGEGQEQQEVFDTILSGYYSVSSPVNEAVLVQIQDHEIDQDLNESERNALFVFSELLSISGLSAREYFGIGLSYQNRDNFRLVIQRYSEPGGVAIVSRRRDGTSTNLVVGDALHFQMPHHVISSMPNRLDLALLEALLEARALDDWDRYYEAIVNFNLANTDDSQISEHIESVLLVSAFERLFDCRSGREDDVASSFTESLAPESTIEPKDCPMIAKNDRYNRYGTVREAWVRDFFRLRGSHAHGQIDSSFTPAWSLRNHLLLGSFVFPLALKKELSKNDLYSLTETDEEFIDCFEALACRDHFLPHPDRHETGKHPWDEVMQHIIHERMKRKIVESLEGYEFGSDEENPT